MIDNNDQFRPGDRIQLTLRADVIRSPSGELVAAVDIKTAVPWDLIALGSVELIKRVEPR